MNEGHATTPGAEIVGIVEYDNERRGVYEAIRGSAVTGNIARSRDRIRWSTDETADDEYTPRMFAHNYMPRYSIPDNQRDDIPRTSNQRRDNSRI